MVKVKRKNWKKLNLKEHYGCGEACCSEDVDVCPIEKGKNKLGIKFQVADVVKPLISVKRLVEKGNFVNFGPEPKDNFIENRQSNCRVGLIPTPKGSYLLKANFVGGAETDIVVDSGAEENVCPKWWGESFGLDNSGRTLNLRSASEARISHWGEREVVVESSF
jgi:hypothetical protein